MARVVEPSQPARKRRPAALTPEQRNNQLIDMSYDAAEDMILSGKATSQLITHFLKQGTARDNLEVVKLEREVELLKARTDSIASSADTRDLLTEVIAAMTEYKTGGVD